MKSPMKNLIILAKGTGKGYYGKTGFGISILLCIRQKTMAFLAPVAKEDWVSTLDLYTNEPIVR